MMWWMRYATSEKSQLNFWRFWPEVVLQLNMELMIWELFSDIAYLIHNIIPLKAESVAVLDVFFNVTLCPVADRTGPFLCKMCIRDSNISFFSIPSQFPLNAFFLRSSYAYLTAEQYHTGTICWINQCENRGVFYAGGRAKTSCGWLLSQKVLFVYAVTFSNFRYGCLSHTPAFHNPEIHGYTFLLPQYLPWYFSLK